jgi:hypothetical protein
MGSSLRASAAKDEKDAHVRPPILYVLLLLKRILKAPLPMNASALKCVDILRRRQIRIMQRASRVPLRGASLPSSADCPLISAIRVPWSS